jgi:hypothetical protein
MEVSETDSEPSHPQDLPVSAQKIIEEIKSLEKELSELQESCLHPKYTIRNCQNSFSLKRICDVCQSDLGYPTQQEMDKWMNS